MSTKEESKEEDRGSPFTSRDVLTDTKAALGPLVPTALDVNGVERIVGPAVDTWEPAPVGPTDEAIAHRENVAAILDARKDERLGVFSLGSDAPAEEPAADAKDAKDAKSEKK
jgi:hypothetical protein